MYMDQNLVRAARRVDLAEYLLLCHPDRVKIVGHSLRLRDHDSLFIRFGYCGYMRFSNGEHGNSIDFLMRYFGYSFREAVESLTSHGKEVHVIPADAIPLETEVQMDIPPHAQPPYKRVFAYLCKTRGIPSEVVQMLFRKGLLYQEEGTGNAVFINPDHTFCELRGTNSSPEFRFHGIRRTAPDKYWSICSCPRETAQIAFICEGAIDAVSLMVLHQKEGMTSPANYIALGGVANQQIIDLVASVFHPILAVDNDAAGAECRGRNPALEFIMPKNKDWNEDLLGSIQNMPCMS